jgi:hypothetical protein
MLTAAVFLFPACSCTLSQVQIEKNQKCLDSLVAVATSPECINQCINANWVGCAMGCGMGLLAKAVPDCSAAVANLFVTPPATTGGSGGTVGPNDLVCKEAKGACLQAEEAVLKAFNNVKK